MKNCFKSIKLVLKEYPLLILYYVYNLIYSITMSLLPVYIINYIVKSYPNFNYVNVIIMFLVMCVLSIISFLMSLYNDYVEMNIKPRISMMLYKKLSEIDYDFHESPKFLNDFSRALEFGSENIYELTSCFFTILIDVISSLSILGIIYILTPFALIFVIVIGIIYFILRTLMSKQTDKYQSARQHLMRKTMYANRAFTLKDSIADIKTTGIEKVLLENNNKAYDDMIKVHKKYMSKRTMLSIVGEFLFSLLYPGLVLIICYFSTKEADVATFSSLTVAATTLSLNISSISSDLGRFQDASVEAKVPFELFSMKGLIEGIKKRELNEDFTFLDVSNLSFSYNNETLALNNISLHIKKGEHIAIVGENGSGKTTLVKLLLHLYDPTTGNILINNKNYNDIDVKSLRSKVGAVFQNIEMYALSIAENILLRKVKNEDDICLVNEALKFADLYDFVYSLEKNIYTNVTREFEHNGVVFSGGQIQKLAIARGYAQNYQLFILDEPSSALDPIAETNLYNKMLDLGKDRTLIFISHRLTATVNANYIYLFEDGKIIEEGTHNELMKMGGKYKEMFVSQSHKYIGEADEK